MQAVLLRFQGTLSMIILSIVSYRGFTWADTSKSMFMELEMEV